MSFLGGGDDLSARALSEEQIAAVLAEGMRYSQGWKRAWPHDRTMWPVVFGLLCEFGPRVSELFWLKRSDVDLARSTIALTTLKRWKTIEGDEGRRYGVRLHRKRVFPLRPWLADVLRAHLEALPPGDMVFLASTDQGWRCRIWRAWKECCKRAGVGNRKTHDARHTVGTRLAERDPILARDVLDHKSLETTSRYIRCRDLAQKFLAVPGTEPKSASPAPLAPQRPPRVKVSTKGRSWRYKSRAAVLNAAKAGNPAAQRRLRELGLTSWRENGKDLFEVTERPAGV